MTDETAEIIEGIIEKFDALREVYFDRDVRCFLLLKDEFQESSYSVLMELTEGYYFYFSAYFNSFKLNVATLEDSFKDISDTATHIAFDGDIYVIPPDNRVVIKPNGKKPYYQFFSVQTDPLEKFVLPEAE